MNRQSKSNKNGNSNEFAKTSSKCLESFGFVAFTVYNKSLFMVSITKIHHISNWNNLAPESILYQLEWVKSSSAKPCKNDDGFEL